MENPEAIWLRKSAITKLTTGGGSCLELLRKMEVKNDKGQKVSLRENQKPSNTFERWFCGFIPLFG